MKKLIATLALSLAACSSVTDDPGSGLPGPGPGDPVDAAPAVDAPTPDSASTPDGALSICATPQTAVMTVTFSEPFVLRDAAFAFDPASSSCTLQSGSSIGDMAIGFSQAATFHATSGFDWSITSSTYGAVSSGGTSVDPLPTETDVSMTIEHDSGEPRLQVSFRFDEAAHTVTVTSVVAL